MLELNPPHLDDFTLLRYVAEDLDDSERMTAADHLRACNACRKTVAEIADLDRELKAIVANPETRADFDHEDLPADDPFRRRPQVASRLSRGVVEAAEAATHVISSSEEGMVLSSVILDSVKTSARELKSILERLDLLDPATRFALLYTLQEASRQITENPPRFLAFAEGVTARLTSLESECPRSKAEELVPGVALLAQAQLLAGQSCLWNGQLEKAASHLVIAYGAFGNGDDELGLARVEIAEAQRRFFAKDGETAFVLARRATLTFELFGLEDEIARGRVAEGMALFQMNRAGDAIACFQRALPVFESRGLWSNFVGTLNALSHCLVKIGRLDEARRAYAQALRRLSRDQHRSWIPFIRKGLAESLFAGQRYREAAIAAGQAAKLYREDGQISRSLLASLFEVEGWARSGDLSRARHRLELFRQEIGRHGILDATLQRSIDEALTGDSSDFREIAQLRESARDALVQRFGAHTA